MAAAPKSVPLQAEAAPSAADSALTADGIAGSIHPASVAVHAAEASDAGTVGTGEGAPKRDGLFVVHDAIRRHLDVLVQALGALADNAAFPEGHPDQRRHIDQLLQWFRDEFCCLVHSHHANEDEELLPMLAERAAAAGVKPPSDGIAADHKWLVRRTERISELLSNASLDEAGRTETKLRALQGHSQELRRRMRVHLSDEERCIPGMCATLLTEEDHATLNKALFKRERVHGLRGAARMLHTAPPDDRAIIYATMPCCIACIVHRCSIPAYTANQARLAREIYDKGPPPRASCCC